MIMVCQIEEEVVNQIIGTLMASQSDGGGAHDNPYKLRVLFSSGVVASYNDFKTLLLHRCKQAPRMGSVNLQDQKDLQSCKCTGLQYCKDLQRRRHTKQKYIFHSL